MTPLISWRTFCIPCMYRLIVAFSNFSFFTYFPNSIFLLFWIRSLFSPSFTSKIFSKNYEWHFESDKRCLDFSPKMHQKRLAAGFAGICWGSLQRSPDSLSGFKGYDRCIVLSWFSLSFYDVLCFRVSSLCMVTGFILYYCVFCA